MRKFILSSLELFSRIAILLILASGAMQGVIGGSASGEAGGAIIGGLVGFLASLIVCVILFGAIFLLMEIAENSRRSAEALEALKNRSPG